MNNIKRIVAVIIWVFIVLGFLYLAAIAFWNRGSFYDPFNSGFILVGVIVLIIFGFLNHRYLWKTDQHTDAAPTPLRTGINMVGAIIFGFFIVMTITLIYAFLH